jgi:hypothetical protein
MKLPRVVVRLPGDDKEALDRLRDRYFDETRRGISRAAVVRAILRRVLAGAGERRASEVLREPEVAAASLRAAPLRSRGAPAERT